jgi:hypothetical protein
VAVLEGPRKTGPATALRRPARDVAAFELDGARRRQVEAGDHVHQGRLAGAVRPDQADHLVPFEAEVDRRQGLHAFEGAGDAGRPERPGRPASLRLRLCQSPA